MTARVRAALTAAVLGALLAGCSGGPDPASSSASSPPSSSASPSASASAGPTQAPDPPEAGTCHRLTLDQAAAATATEDQEVPCRERHTSVTIAVEPLDLVDDGHLLAVGSDAAQERLREQCAPALARWVGGDETARRLSRLEVVWFAPSPDDLQAGADQLRCDLVAVRSEGRLLPLTGRARNLLDQPAALDTVGTCGTAAPSADDFERVACAARHRWRAVDVVDLPDGARFLGDAATEAADSACQDVASARSGGSLELTWAFEWPTREQWDAGQRWGWCWIPQST